MRESFDYNKSVKAVEALIARVEDPATGVEESEKLIKEASGLLEKCYAWLRTERENLKYAYDIRQ